MREGNDRFSCKYKNLIDLRNKENQYYNGRAYQLGSMLTAQAKLQREIDKQSHHLDDPLEKQAMHHALSIMMEGAEIMDRLPFKHWKHYSKQDVNKMLTSLDLAEEVVDVLHFIFNLWLCLGYTSDDLFAMYMLKNKVNFERQERGY